MNSKGQTLGLSIVSIIFVLIIGLMMTNFLFDDISNFRINLSCSDAANISDSTKLLCLVVDIVVPYWIVLVFGVIISIILLRLKL